MDVPDERTLSERLEEVRRTPLDQITAEQAGAVVEHIIKREANRLTVDVARFASSL